MDEQFNPSNFSQWCADNLHRTNVEITATLPTERPCGHLGCPYWAWRHEPEFRDGRWTATYECQKGHVTIVTSLT